MYSKIKSHSFLDERYYTAKLKNGIEVIIYPKKDTKSSLFSISFKFGSGISMVKDVEKDETIIIPPGTAHFLEHMMFYDDNGVSYLKRFDDLNIYNNGTTGRDYTDYSIDIVDKDFTKPFLMLLDMIFNKPYFSDEAFVNERNIILQEALEVKDYYKNIHGKLIDMAYGKNFEGYSGIKNNIGTKEDLYSISKELLYECYELFYHPENCLITIIGDVNESDIIAFLEDYFKNRQFNPRRKISFDFECPSGASDEENVYDYIERIINDITHTESDSSNVIVEGNELVQVGLLFKLDGNKMSTIDKICIALINEYLLDDKGVLYKSFFDSGLLESDIVCMHNSNEIYNYLFISFYTSRLLKNMSNRIITAIRRLSKNTFTNKEFLLAKKMIYANVLRKFEDDEGFLDMVQELFYLGIGLDEFMNGIFNLTKAEVQQAFSKILEKGEFYKVFIV